MCRPNGSPRKPAAVGGGARRGAADAGDGLALLQALEERQGRPLPDVRRPLEGGANNNHEPPSPERVAGVTGEEARVAIDAGIPGTAALLVGRFAVADVVEFFSLDRRYRHKPKIFRTLS